MTMISDAANTAIQNNHNNWHPSERIMQLKRQHDSNPPSLGAERAIHYTEFYKSGAVMKLHPAIRKARALAYHLQQRSIHIPPKAVFAGHHTEHDTGAICHVEFAGFAMLEDLFRFEKRPVNPLKVDPRSRRKLALSVIPFWITRNLSAKAFKPVQTLRYMYEQLHARQYVINEAGGIAHFLPDYQSLITLGSNGMRAAILQKKNQTGLDDDQIKQLEARLIVLDAFECLINRYRQLAVHNHQTELAELLENMPDTPPTSLHQALQLIWFAQAVIQIESLDQGISLGRLDQILYPLYLKEKQSGTFNENRFRDLMCAFCLKCSEVIPLFSERTTKMFAGLASGQALTLGGLNDKGECAANPLTFLMLDVIERFKTRQPNWHARISQRSSPAYRQRVFEVISSGGGSPALYNDEIIMAAMKPRFAGARNLWNYATVGCVEPALPGESFTSSDASIFNYAAILENILSRHSPASHRQKRKLSQINDSRSLLIAVEGELNRQLDKLQQELELIEKANKNHHPVPFSSLFVQGTLDSARDLTAGGARYNASGIQAMGIADLADSLAAIDTLVFQQKSHSITDIAMACHQNFHQQTALQSHLKNLQKFGNDQSLVDQYVYELANIFDQAVSKRRNSRGGKWMAGCYSMTCHQAMGARTGALPSGRSRGQSLADGLSPGDGNDYLGPTALLNSITQLNARCFPNGINLNIKFNALTLKGKTGPTLLSALIDTYFQNGGMQIQVNVLDHKELIDARNHPERYRHLLVRVSGYSAHFVDLTPEMQDEIIRRSMQSV